MRRIERLNEQFKREITSILRDHVRDPRIGRLTVTGVDVTSDLWVARVHLRLFGDDADRREALAGLEAAAPFIRRALASSLRIRRVPELRFVEDQTQEQASRIEEILRSVLPDEQEPHGADADPEELEDGEGEG
ncbi:MAG: 30S ribosome-binding factor RbfA [Gemmatimonadota bacterium]|nr:MAG: 30S ribosome-binding factor RbfA [Gemmatimonadota bacterium]